MIDKILTILLFVFYCIISFVFGLIAANNEQFIDFSKVIIGKLASAISSEITSSLDKNITVWTDIPAKKHDGLLLLAGHFINNPAIIMVNADGKILHKWDVEKKIFNPEIIKLHKDLDKTDKESVHSIEDAILFPDGSIIFSQSLMEFNNYRSQRLAKIDKDSNVIWQIPGLFHHDLSLGEDGNIYSVGSEIAKTIPGIIKDEKDNIFFVKGLIKIISIDGKVIKTISLEDAFANSDYQHLLSLFNLDIDVQKLRLKDDSYLFDPIHLNSVQYIGAETAAKVEFMEAGDLLVSMRGNSVIAVLRPSEEKIIWATRGPWRHQHYVRMTNKGSITIYDNDGASVIATDKDGEAIVRHQSRVIEFYPETRKTDILFYNPSYRDMYSYWRGYYKKLADGSFIISSPERGRVVQADENGNIIWELRTIEDREKISIPYTKRLSSVKYYEKDDISFLDCDGCADN